MGRPRKNKIVEKPIEVIDYPKVYKITFQINGERFTVETSDINQAIIDAKPDFLHAEMYITVEKDNNIQDRKLNLLSGRKLFSNEVYREIFINNLMMS